MKFKKIGGRKFFFALAWLAALILRLAGIKWGLPNTFNGDEPHLINLAVSFGKGSLRPYAFKYPTLWPYFLFVCYGFYYLFWSRLGAGRGLLDFAGLYGWNPTGFYLIARLTASFFSLSALYVLYAAGKDREEFRWAWLFAAFSPLLVYSAHEAKPDSLMFFFACLGWRYALKAFESGRRGDCRRSAAFFGLAFSSQFTALPAVSALFLTYGLSRRKLPGTWALESAVIYAAAFLLGSPYALLDFHNFWFWIHMHAPAAMDALAPWSRRIVAGRILANLGGFFYLGLGASFLACLGMISLLSSTPRLLGVLAGPVLISFLILVNNPDGGTLRYLIPVFPPLAFLASQGFVVFLRGRAAAFRRVFAAAWALLILVPALRRAAAWDEEMRLPDTRFLAEGWIAGHIPQGAVILADEPDTEPRLFMTRKEILALAERAEKNGSPRSRLYFAMARTHPGGGYWVYRIKRSAWDLDVHHPLQVRLSQEDSPMLALASGIKAARAAGVQYVIASSTGVNLQRDAALRKFFKELGDRGKLLREFDPVPGQVAGPVIKIYRIPGGNSNGISPREQPRLF